MRCRDARELLSASLDNELASSDRAVLTRHVDSCASCRATRTTYEVLRTQFRVTHPVAVDLVPALRERLSGMAAPEAVVLDQSRAREPHWSRLLVGAAAAALIVVVLAAVVSRRDGGVDVVTSRPAVVPELRAPNGASLLLAWTTGGLPDRALERTRALVGVTGVTVVSGAQLALTGEHDRDGGSRLALPEGAAIPIDALAVDRSDYARDLPPAAARVVRALPRDGALLGATSARLRGVGVGGTLTFGPTTVTVNGVLADSLVGAAEVVVPTSSPLAVRRPRFLLVAYRGDRSDLESEITAALKTAVRFRAPGEAPYLRQGDAVLPQALVKARFGEFWYRADAHGTVMIDPVWVARNIVTIDVAGFEVRCHRLVATALRRALAEMTQQKIAVGVAFNPQLISPSLGLSRHTWGIGITVHAAPAAQAPLIATMAKLGFRWGGLWLNRSPDYYEWIGPTT